MPIDQETAMEIINDHYRNPRNYGKIDNPTLSITEHNPVCGDTVHFTISVVGERISDIKFIGSGCSISQASASMLTEVALGRSIDDLRNISEKEWLERMGITLGPNREKCALLSLNALKKLLAELQSGRH